LLFPLIPDTQIISAKSFGLCDGRQGIACGREAADHPDWRKTRRLGTPLGEQMSKKTRGVVAFAALCGLSLFLLNCGSTVNRSSGLLYVLIQGSNNVSSYAIDLNSGKLSLINSNARTCANTSCGFPLDIILDPTGATAFVLNQGTFNSTASGNPVAPSIYGYKVNSDGSLATGADVSASAFTVGDLAVAMARDAAGKFLFVVTQGLTTCNAAPAPAGCPQLYVFTAQTGSTSLSLASQISLSRVPTGIAAIAGPNSTQLLYVTGNKDLITGENDDNTLSEYSVDASGNLKEYKDPNTGLPYTTPGNPSAVLAVTTVPIGGSGGTFIYVASVATNSVSAYQLCTIQSANCAAQDVANFRLIPVGSPANAGSDPVAMVVDPTSQFLFVASENSSQVFGFRINGTQGTLSALSPANLSTGLSPIALAMHSSGKFLFVSNNGSSNISSFNVDTTSGAMSSPTTVTTSNAQPAGLVSK
jgi:6-phosphogluconolactonase (cycloisomerase 2 family)